ncbi:PspA/IM30 family protein [Marinobacterium sp. D7]|uniref:PspA/IM30 family protein n=1 Tax=Marinobacterium ramblicola TaxID=2849041 RepID=UPI001C2DD263|nr:PspA/IM30 family protein [Marinobacterium ramblicola]MBV1787414.1 PspA/IM30 family protein [Marinobacterium ramblicola]
MSVFKKLLTALKGHATTAAEAVADNQALVILDQEIRETEAEIRKSEQALTSIVAKEKLSQQKVAALQDAIAEHEGYAVAAMDKGNESLALEVAEKIAEFEEQLQTEQGFLDQVTASIVQLRKDLKSSKNALRLMKQQVDTVKATASVQKAQESLSSRHLNTDAKMRTAYESLERIQTKQQHRAAEIDAAREMASAENGDDLKAKLSQAGIGGSTGSANDILARLKNRDNG